jgi:hypothetical protein
MAERCKPSAAALGVSCEAFNGPADVKAKKPADVKPAKRKKGKGA